MIHFNDIFNNNQKDEFHKIDIIYKYDNLYHDKNIEEKYRNIRIEKKLDVLYKETSLIKDVLIRNENKLNESSQHDI